MDTYRVHEEGGHCIEHQHDGEQRVRQFTLCLDNSAEGDQQFAANKEHEEREAQPARDCEQRDARPAAEGCQHDGEHAPRHCIVERAGGQRQRAERSIRKPALVDNAREHRESGERDARTHKQGRAALPQSVGEEPGNIEQEGGDRRREQERRDNPSRRNADRAFRLRLEMIEAQGRTDEEHVESDAELCADIKNIARLLRKQRRLPFGKEKTEERGADQDARDHFADDLRLAEELLGGPADDAADKQNHRDLEEEMDAEIGRGIACGNARRRAVRAENIAGRPNQLIEHIGYQLSSPPEGVARLTI